MGWILDTENLHVNKLVDLQTLTNDILSTMVSAQAATVSGDNARITPHAIPISTMIPTLVFL